MEEKTVNLTPVSNAVLIEQIVVDKKFKSIIIPENKDAPKEQKITDQYDEYPLQAKVVAIGKNVTECVVGDKVALSLKATGNLLPYLQKGKEYFIAYEHQLIGVIND